MLSSPWEKIVIKIAILAGSIGGIVWATALVDFTPPWYDRLAGSLQLLVLLLPVLIHLCCSLLVRWWGGRACVAYVLVVLAWWVAASLYNEATNHNLVEFTPAELALPFVAGACVLGAAWAAGRGLRRVLKR